jgi:flotillin
MDVDISMYMNVYMYALTGLGLLVALVLWAVSVLYKRCQSNEILVVYGRTGGDKSAKCYHGGGAIIWPFIQDSKFLQLTPRTISIPLKGALSMQNIRINVPSTFTIAIDSSAESVDIAVVRLLGLSDREVENMSAEIITGQLRLTVASLSIEEINKDREKFLDQIRENVEPELKKIGLVLLNVNITDITDESDYIESIGKKAAAKAINQAKIDVAEQEKSGEIGRAEAEKERRIKVAEMQAKAVEGENKSAASVAIYNATLAEAEAESQQRSQVAKQNAEVNIQTAKALAETKRLRAEEVVPQEISREKVEIEAKAVANKRREEARGEADALLMVKEAEAKGIEKVLAAKAKGYETLVKACGSNPKDAGTMLMIEKLNELVPLQTEAIKNIKFDKVIVWENGTNSSGKTSTADFLSGMVKSLPALHDVAKMTGLELPEYLGSTNNEDKKELEEKEAK